MKSYYCLLVFLFCVTISIAQTTAIIDNNFEQDLVTQGIDTNGLNGNILNTDALAITALTISRNDIIDFTGLEAFTNLITLDLGRNDFLTAPLTTLVLLEELVFDDNNILDSLDLTQNINLRILNIGTTGGGANVSTITTLDLSQNLLLETIYIYAFLELNDLIFPQTGTLHTIQVIAIDEDVFDFTNHSGLEELLLNQNTSTTSIVLPFVKTTLKKLDIRNQRVSNIDLTGFSVLEDISLTGTEVEVLILPNNTVLSRLNISRHKLPSIFDLTSVPNIEDLTITYNLLLTPFEVNLTALSILTDLNLSNNKMVNLDITQNTQLINLNVSNNNLSTFDTNQNSLIVNLNASQNILTSLDFLTNIELIRLTLNDNLLPTLDLSTNIKLTYLNLRTNALPTIDLITNVALITVNLGENLLPILDVTSNIQIVNLYIDYNLFTATGLDLTQNEDLQLLDASFNQIESLNISQNLRLDQLIINNNIFPGNDILNQFYQVFIDSNRKFVWYDKLIVHHNLLTGKIPNFSSLVKNPPAGESFDTFNFYLEFEENRFHFGDFEEEHSDYVNFLVTGSPRYGSLKYFRTYTYAPQAKVNAIENPNRNAGENITLTTTVRGAENHYVWFKDGVIIPDAPDTPEYTIIDLNACDAGVYHSEIRSDLVPFENSNPPGTNGKNLLLVRNDITLTVNTTKECITLINPANGDNNVPINTGIEWVDNPGACSYKLLVTDIDTGTIIVNNLDVGEDTLYNFASDLPINTNISVLVIPVFEDGDYTTGCTAETFTTSTHSVEPDCTLLASPINGDINVQLDLNEIRWTPANGADGYRITITGSTSTINNVTDLDIPAGTIHNFVNPFDEGETVTISIIPYNTVGDAIGPCGSESFTIEAAAIVIPNCTSLNSPINGGTNVSVSSDVSWNPIVNATGYMISIGTTPGGTDLVNGEDVGNVTTYNPATDFPDESDIYITITSYNTAGNATGCAEENFTTETLIPNCTNISLPIDGATNVSVSSDVSWNPIANATGYIISIGTTSGGTDLVNGVDVGNITTYNPVADFPDESDIYVTITPYNTAGSATGCAEEQFITETILPECTSLVSPLNGATNVSISTDFTWNLIPNATGYRINIGTNMTFFGEFDAGNVLTYDLAFDLPENMEILVRIIPYNSAGDALGGCTTERFTTETLIPNCTNLSSPIDGETNVSINSDVSWNPIVNATGYIISIGTTSGGTDLVNAVDVGNIITYNPTTNFPDESEIFITIIPYNTVGNATGCSQESFITETVVPICSELITPLNGSVNVSISSDISWDAITNAEGYYISIGTISGGVDIANGLDVGNVTSFNPAASFPENSEIYVNIAPYNSAGIAAGCIENIFITESIIPNCSNLSFPYDGATNISVSSDVSWNSISNATGYIISIGTTSYGTDIINSLNVGNVTSFNPVNDFPDDTEIFVTITPYNSAGNGINCAEESFITENRIIVIPKYFTPNGDGYNDIWIIQDPKNEIKNIYIYNRYGRLIKSITDISIGWNGNISGKPLITDDYWCSIELFSGKVIREHFTLKR